MARQAVARRAAVREARGRTASLLAVVLVVSGLGYVAVAGQGSTVHQTDLHDAGVWVSSDAQAKFAKANVPIGQLESGVATSVGAGSGLDVLQDGAAVVGVGVAAGQLFPIDPRTSSAGEAAAPVGAVARVPDRLVASPVDLRGGTIAVLDPGSGKVWAQRVDSRAGVTSLPALSPSSRPVATVGRTAAIAVDERGSVHAVSGATGKVTTVAATASGFAAPVTVDTGLRSAAPDITAVGSTWVAYDAGKDTVYTAEAPTGLEAQVITPGGSRAAR
ncbi:MAG: Ig-like domain-containing protein, partial [Phycicoccus sp.]